VSDAHMADARVSRSEGRTPRIREKRRTRRAEILDAALRSFREKGYYATTLDDIAERVGVRKTALYHYYPDKQALLFECHRESIAELDRMMTESRGGTPVAFEVTALSAERHAPLIEGRDRYEHELRRIIDRGMRDGELRRGNSKVAVFVLLGALNWISRWYRPEGEFHASELGGEFVENLLGGLERRPRVTRARTGRSRPAAGAKKPGREARP
jgi:AcrR family transcriptional regulator